MGKSYYKNLKNLKPLKDESKKSKSSYDEEEKQQFFQERKIVMPTATKNKKARLAKRDKKIKQDLKKYYGSY